MEEMARGAKHQLHGNEEGLKALTDMVSRIQYIYDTSNSMFEASTGTKHNAVEGNQKIQYAVRQMDQIKLSVQESTQAVHQLDTRSNQISQIIDVITSIAAQTNLLALNAAIESARAGEHGRGFSVVAGEIRKLAEQSGESAHRIVDMIKEMLSDTQDVITSMSIVNERVEKGLYAAEAAGTAFERIVEEIEKVVGSIKLVSDGVQYIIATPEEITAAMEETVNIAGLSATSAESVSKSANYQRLAMQQIADLSNSLKSMVIELSQLIRHFKS
jgi:methyl-accepting chemotaxis protein